MNKLKNIESQYRIKLKNIDLQNGEIIVSYDVMALITTIPIKDAISNLEDLLVSLDIIQKGVEKAKLLKKLSAICMTESYFIFRGIDKTIKVSLKHVARRCLVDAQLLMD